MDHVKQDSTNISFGRLYDPGVLPKSPFSGEQIKYKYFTNKNFQYITDNIVDIFGFPKGTVQVSVIDKDLGIGWHDKNQDGKIDLGEICLRYTMNGAICVYTRESFYGKHFMYDKAKEFGNPFVFGVIAHEVGHLVNNHTMTKLEKKQVGKNVCFLTETQVMDARWDELCADYLAGIVLAKAVPRISPEPFKRFIKGTVADKEHPDGIWREIAIEMGYQWGCANATNLLKTYSLMDQNFVRNLLISFVQNYYQKVYLAVSPEIRSKYSTFSQNMVINCCNWIARI